MKDVAENFRDMCGLLDRVTEGLASIKTSSQTRYVLVEARSLWLLTCSVNRLIFPFS